VVSHINFKLNRAAALAEWRQCRIPSSFSATLDTFGGKRTFAAVAR